MIKIVTKGYKNHLRKALMELLYKANLVLRRSSDVAEKEYASIIGRAANDTYRNLDKYPLADIYGMFTQSKEHLNNLDTILSKVA